MNYEVLVLDIDDTLLTSDLTISQKTYEALIHLQQRGKKVVLASGRPTASMMKVAKQLRLDEFDSYIISFNGAVITRVKDGSELFSQRLDVDVQRDIIHYLRKNNLAVLTYESDTIMVDSRNAYSDIESQLTGLPTVYDADWFEQLNRPRLKFIGVGNPDIVAHCDAQLQGKFGDCVYVTVSKPYFLEMMHKDVSKGSSIKRLCSHLGYDVSQVIACGDGNNDATMIEVAGLGVAMGNATDTLKQLADVITLSNDEDGIVAVIEKYMQG